METKTLLIVDSLEINRTVLSAMLGTRYQVIEAVDGESALEILAADADAIDVVMLAFDLDGMSGIATLQIMRDAGYLDSIPVIMIAVDAASGLMGKAYSLGASDFICRPFDMQVVQHRLANALELKCLEGGASDACLAQMQPDQEVYEREIALLSANSARMSMEISQIRRAFTKLTDEAWFEYRLNPATFIANDKLQQMLGVPAVVGDPVNNADAGEVVAHLLRQVKSHCNLLDPGETYFELVIPGELLGTDRPVRHCS